MHACLLHDTHTHTHAHTHTHMPVVYHTVPYKQWVYTWSICQSNVKVLRCRL